MINHRGGCSFPTVDRRANPWLCRSGKSTKEQNPWCYPRGLRDAHEGYDHGCVWSFSHPQYKGIPIRSSSPGTLTDCSKVGNDFIRGVSGGERKRVSIAEAALGGSPLQCWDNSTRGLDSATALEFVRTLRLSTEMAGCTSIVGMYELIHESVIPTN